MSFMTTVRAIALLECMDQIYARQLRGAEVDADPNGTKAFLRAMNGRTLSATGTTPLVKQTGRSLSGALKKADGASRDVIPVRMRKTMKQLEKAVTKIDPSTHAHEVINVRRLKAQSQFVKAVAKKIEPTHARASFIDPKVMAASLAQRQLKKAAGSFKPNKALEVITADKIRELASAKQRELEGGCNGEMPEGWGDCSCQMPACTGGDDPNCATPFTSCMY